MAVNTTLLFPSLLPASLAQVVVVEAEGSGCSADAQNEFIEN